MFAYLDKFCPPSPARKRWQLWWRLWRRGGANPSSLYRFCMDAARRLKAAREQVAKALGAESDRVFFTSGGTRRTIKAVASSLARMGKRGGM